MKNHAETIGELILAIRDAKEIILFGKFSICFRLRRFLKSIGQVDKLLCFCHDDVADNETPRQTCVLKQIDELTPKDGTLVLIAAEEYRHTDLMRCLDSAGFHWYHPVTGALGRQAHQYELIYQRLLGLDLRENLVVCGQGKDSEITKEILAGAFGRDGIKLFELPDCVDGLRDLSLRRKDLQVLLVIDPFSPKSPELHRIVYSVVEEDVVVDFLSPSEYYNPAIHTMEIASQERLGYAAVECCMREIYQNKIPGNVAEAGVYQGETAWYINALFPDRKLYLFDTFSGFDSEDLKDDDKNERYRLDTDFSNTSVQMVLDRMPYPQNCIIKKGWFPDSAADVDDRFCLVRLDMDLYQPIKAGLEFFYPKMVPGGYILVHDCRSSHYAGAREALLEFCRENGLSYMCMPDKLGTAIISIGLPKQ